MSRDDVRNNHSDQDLDLERCAKVPKTASEPVKSGLRHVQTEQRRRDRINEGCDCQCTLQHCTLMLPGNSITALTRLLSALADAAQLCCCRFAALKALMPGQEKMDKATFLNSTVEYIKQLQVCRRPPTRHACIHCKPLAAPCFHCRLH